jgi:hypothetical protein
MDMTDRIDQIVDRAAQYTNAHLSNEATQWPAAREGLERILDDLGRRAPDHPGLLRLRRFIDDLSLIHGDGKTRDGDASAIAFARGPAT